MEIPAAINRKSQHDSTEPVQPEPLRYNSTLAVEAKKVCTEKGLLALATGLKKFNLTYCYEGTW
jgi:hypothetical protein